MRKKDTAPEKCAESLKVDETSMEEPATEQVESNTEKESVADATANGVCTVCGRAPKDDRQTASDRTYAWSLKIPAQSDQIPSSLT